MNFKTFKTCIETYGASFEQWPEHLKSDGIAFLKSKPELCTDIMTIEVLLDQKLNCLRDTHLASEHLSSARYNNIAHGVFHSLELTMPNTEDEGYKSRLSPFRLPPFLTQRDQQPQRRLAGLLLAVVCIGFGGFYFSQPSPTPFVEPEQNHWQIAATDMGLSDIYSWVEGEASEPAPTDNDL